MGNLFIGFPVPRAKIAEMIEGYAPPVLHADRHEESGNDEISYLELLNRKHASRHESGGDDEITIDAAGIATLYDDLGFHFKTFFPTLDEFVTGQAGTGSFTHTPDKISLATGSTTSSWAKVLKNTAYQLPLLTYDKNIFIRFRCVFNIFPDVNPNSYIITSDATNHKHIGVSMYNNKLAYSIHTGTSRYQGEIISCAGTGTEYDKIVDIKFYTGDKVEYWIDGILEHTQSTDLPTGAFYDENFLRVAVSNSNTTRDITLVLSMLELYQPAA